MEKQIPECECRIIAREGAPMQRVIEYCDLHAKAGETKKKLDELLMNHDIHVLNDIVIRQDEKIRMLREAINKYHQTEKHSDNCQFPLCKTLELVIRG